MKHTYEEIRKRVARANGWAYPSDPIVIEALDEEIESYRMQIRQLYDALRKSRYGKPDIYEDVGVRVDSVPFEVIDSMIEEYRENAKQAKDTGDYMRADASLEAVIALKLAKINADMDTKTWMQKFTRRGEEEDDTCD